ncbi:hypothetical protein [Streptomyces puniciscabiei]
MHDPELLERLTARRAERDERVLERGSEQLADERASAAPMGRWVDDR